MLWFQSFSLKIKTFLDSYYQPKYFVIFLIRFLILLLFISSTYTFIGRGDYANYSNVARNLVQGKGFTVDYLAWHYIQYPQVSHAEDMWPLLQPVWIAFSFFLFGVSPFAARIPNAIFFTLLILIIYFIGTKLFNSKIGFWAAILTSFNINLLKYSTDWITSDVALAVMSLIIFYLGYQLLLESTRKHLSLGKVFFFGLIAGLAVLQKPMGILLPSVYVPFVLYFYRRDLNKLFKPTLVFLIAILIPVGPFFIRNMILFGTLFLPIEHYLGYQIKYFPYETIFSIQYGHPPTLKTWFDYGWVNFLRINWQYFRYSVDTFVYKDLLMPYTVIVLSLLGLRNLKDQRKFFFYPLVLLFVIMSTLMATYWHYESRYYAMLIPIFNLLAVICFFELFPKVNWKNATLVVILIFITFLPSLKAVLEGVKPKVDDPALIAYTWIKNNTSENSVIMTLTPWELNFHSERQAIVIPNEDKNQILWMAKKYNSDYLELEFLTEVKRQSLKDLYLGRGTQEFIPLYLDGNRIYIYKINWEKVNLDPNTKPYWY